MPIIANAFAGSGGAVSNPHDVSDTKMRGGMWGGKVAVVIYCDGSAEIRKTDRSGALVLHLNGREANMFVPFEDSEHAWLKGCTELNPK